MDDKSSDSQLVFSLQSAVPDEEASVQNRVLSVADLNRQIRQLIEGELGTVWVQGEISNFKAHTSGHFYFSIKDSKSQISAVMFRGHNSKLKFKPHDGLEVLVRAKVSVYEPRGQYQIVCEHMEPVGAGALQKAFEQLKEKLKSEGLFDSARKRPLPSLPRHIAIVTSPTGAAIRDMMNVLSRRNRSAQITVIPTIVQGDGAGSKIKEALVKAFRLPDVDVIIIGRGGGSIEDLWCFNDEALARTIVMSPVPVVSAVGHEIDFTISDFVADLRAPTPSAAPELVMKNADDLVQHLGSLKRLLFLSMEKSLKAARQHQVSLERRLVDPKRKLQDLIQRRDELMLRLIQSTFAFLSKERLKLEITTRKMPTPDRALIKAQGALQLKRTRLIELWSRRFEFLKSHLHEQMSLLDSLSPLKVVERGYSIVTKDQQLIKSVQQVQVGDQIQVQLMEGRIHAEIKSVKS